jgi:hypothetical protein
VSCFVVLKLDVVCLLESVLNFHYNLKHGSYIIWWFCSLSSLIRIFLLLQMMKGIVLQRSCQQQGGVGNADSGTSLVIIQSCNRIRQPMTGMV